MCRAPSQAGRIFAGTHQSKEERMMHRLAGLALLALALVFVLSPAPAISQQQTADPENTLVIELKTGRVLIRLRPDLAPMHVKRVKRLAKEGFYDGLTFHRVIPGFMAQTGDPNGDGSGGSKYVDLKPEFTTKERFGRGSVGAARLETPVDSANSQFFICFGVQCAQLTGSYTMWGEVIQGMELVDKIAAGEPPTNPDRMLKVYVLADKK
jgi:peptidylprolyl isomerase